jgi:hypothetical protein
MDKEQGFAADFGSQRHSKTPYKNIAKAVLSLAALLSAGVYQYSDILARSPAWGREDILEVASKQWNPQCPVQPEPIVPRNAFSLSDTFRDEAAERLAQAVRIPTVSYDDNGAIGEDVSRRQCYDGGSS